MKKFKKALSVFLVAVMLLTAAPLSGFVGLELPDWSIKAEAAEVEGNYYYTVTDGVATITDVKTAELSGTVTVPSTLGGYPVVAIANYAFDSASKIVSLIVPEGIKTAGNYAFRGMTGMITVQFKGIETIGQEAFYNCSKLTDVDLGPALKKIDDCAFFGVAYINKITFPDTIEYIGYRAFYSATNLAEINIPDKAFEIQGEAFYGTSWYNAQSDGEVYLNTIFYQYKGSYPSTDTVVTIKEGTKAIAACAFKDKYSNIVEVQIPDSVQFIGYKAFWNCDELKKVNIPDGITSIEYYTFADCVGLTELVIPESVTNFETYAFYNCYNLKSINIPGGVTEIPEYTFYNCRKLESIEIPDGVTTIDRYAFYNCDALTEVEIPNGVTFIGEDAFYDCGGLKSISIPDSVTSVGSSAFYNCPAVETLHLGAKTATLGTSTYLGMNALKSFTVSAENETLCAVDGVLFSKDMTTLIKYPEAKEDTSYVIPSTVTTIGEYAFANNDKLTSVTIPESVTTIEQYAFEDCDALTSVTVPKSVTTMGMHAFAYCGAIASVTLPEGLTVIGTQAFYDCDKITSVTIPSTLKTVSKSAFYDCDGITEVIFKEGVETIGEYAFENCNALATVDFADSIKNINYDAFYGCTKLTNLVLPKYIENIRTRAFYNCDGITTLTIPGTVKALDEGAFQNCDGLTEVIHEEGNTFVGYYAFSSCTNLEKVTIASTTKIIYEHAFNNCDKLTSVTIPEGVEQILDYAFLDCDGLTAIVIPDSVTRMDVGAFNSCDKLESVTIGSGLATIPYLAFYRCKALKSITIPGTVTTVGQEAFYGCTALESIILEDGVTTINADAFRNCTALTSVDIPASITSITSDLFTGCTGLAAINVAEDNETYSSEDGVVYNKDKTVLMMYPVGKTDESFVIPSTVKEIKAEAFRDNAYLKNITIPEGVETIGASNFYNCDALVSITVPDSVTSVGGSFCSYSDSIETVTFGKGMTSIPNYTLYRNATIYSIKTVKIPVSITHIGDYTIHLIAEANIIYEGTQGQWNSISGMKSIHSTSTLTCAACPTAHANAYAGEYLAPTCTVKGHEAGKYCPDCLVWIEPQTAIPALNHANKYNTDRIEPTCTEVGYTAGVYCPDCQKYISGHSTISKLNHPTKVREENKAPTCTVDGFYGGLLCTTCGEYVEERVDIPATNHEGTTSTFAEEKATCTESGFTAGEFCNSCGEWVSGHEVIPAINHANAEVYEAVPATCTASGYTEGKYCPDCRTWLVAREYVAALGHTNTEWTQISAPTCTSAGKEQSVCDVCGTTVYRNLDKADHAYGAWITEKEATVLSEGLEVRTCGTCGHRDVKTIDRINVDGNENYGVVNFTVVNAQTLSPIKGASLYIATENDGENTFYTDADGKVSVTLPIGEQTVSAYAKNCLTRSFKITVVNGENDVPVIGLSDKSTYDAELTQKVMTKEEIEDAGIDTEAIGNQQVVKTEMKLVFDEELDVPPIVVETYTAGGKVVGIADTPANVVVEGEGYYSRPGSTANYYYRPPVNDQPSIIIQPVSERCYLIIRGEIKWLKEMFDIELLVVNNSATDTLEDLKATLTLPDGLSLADMIDGEQTLEQEMGTVTESSSKSVHWYVRGDKAGSYDLAAQLTGKIMPLGEEINDTFTCEDQLQVWAGNALHLHYEFPNSAYFGEDYPVTITLTNVSDRTLYNVSHLITEVEQGKIIYDPADGTKDIVYTSESDESWFAFAPEFKPGDKLVIELSIEILFGSEYMLKEIEEIFGDYAAEFVNGYEAVMSGLDAASTLIATVSAAAEALENADAQSELAGMLKDIGASLVSGDKVFTAAAMLVDTGLAQELELIGEDVAAWVASADIEAVTANVEALKKAIIAEATEEETAAFNIFDSLRTLVTSLPTKFVLGDVIFNQEGTTTIPWSYSITGNGPEYYGVSNIGYRLNGVSQAIIGATGDEVSSYLQLIPGIDNPENYVDRDTSVIAVQNEKEQFKAKDATGTVKFTAYYVPAASYSLRNRSVSAENYTLECDNESAVFENGVLTFTGDGTISLTSADANGGVLYIEDDKGNTYSYAVNVVEAHDCIAGAQKTVLSPTSEYDGFAVKCCEICDDVMEIINLTVCDEHTYGDWTTEVEATCTVGGIKNRICTSCAYTETEIVDLKGHTETTINKKDATCTEAGYTGDTVCGACGAEISKGQAIDALKHNMGTFTVTKEATCTADGEERADCSRCDYYETKVISAKGHTEVKIPAVAATCSKSGLTEGKKCSVCGEILVKQTETAKLEHSYKSVVTAPSCTNSGYTTYTCSVCKDTYKANETAKLGHNLGNFIMVEQPSCTEKGSEIAECSRCDYSEVKEISATGHNYQNGVCTECGDSKSNNCSCNCHKSGFMSIIWKILRFFYKLFGTNKVCGCGAAHY